MSNVPYFTDEELKELQVEIDGGWINVNKHPEFDLWIYNYSKSTQYAWRWNKYTSQCRGLILDANHCLVAKGFDKFFTYDQLVSEGLESTIPKGEPFDLYEKADGCCHEDTKVITRNGEYTIKYLCDNMYNDDVLSYNIDKDCLEWDKVVGSNILDNNDDWYEIILDDGTIIKLTGNHKVWLPELMCYRQVSLLTCGDSFLLKKV